MARRALCVGLNYPGSNHQLRGCVQDALAWEDTLRRSFHFETRLLIDQQLDGSVSEEASQIPTRSNVLRNLAFWLVNGAQEGDTLVWVFAGHGCQVVTDDVVLEALLPAAAGGIPGCSAHAGHSGCEVILKEDVQSILRHVPAGVHVTLVLDCSVSAGVLCVGNKSHVNESEPEGRRGPVIAWANVSFPRWVPQVTGRVLDPRACVFLIAAAYEDGGTACEVDMDCKCSRGAMSLALLSALERLEDPVSRCTYETWLASASALLQTLAPHQHIHVHCNGCMTSGLFNLEEFVTARSQQSQPEPELRCVCCHCQ